MEKSTNRIHALYFTLLIVSASCTKQSHLNQPVDQGLQVLATIEDARALLDNTSIMKETPALGELSADDFYVTAGGTIDPVELNAYLWMPDIFMQQRLAGDWFLPYKQIYYANSILATLPNLTGGSQEQLNQVKGTCLFIRGYAFYNVALEFASLYDTDPENEPGIPLPLTPDPEAHYARASIKETYDNILKDINEAVKLLPQQVDTLRKNRPSVPAAFGLLARIYLSMGNFTAAKTVADSCLDRYAHLMNYKNLNAATSHPFPANNEEVLYQSNLLSTTNLFYHNSFSVDSTLYNSYSSQDLRKELYFTNGASGLPIPRFNYSGNTAKFSGLAIDEVFLIRAECHARLGNKESAMQDLTKLLTTRWDNNNYPTPIINTAQEALDLVLTERRKELVFRGLRWIDIRRLNKINPAHTLKRWWSNTMYTLPPGDKRYVLPIPFDVFEVNNNIKQNDR
jgi:starch-binding outer membrane protein, SusD/RagB family